MIIGLETNDIWGLYFFWFSWGHSSVLPLYEEWVKRLFKKNSIGKIIKLIKQVESNEIYMMRTLWYKRKTEQVKY